MIEVRINPQSKITTKVRSWAEKNDLKLILDPKIELELVYVVDPSYMYFEEIT